MNTAESKNRILLVSGIYFPDIGGPATFLPKLAQALLARNFQVGTLSLTDHRRFQRPKENWKRTFISREINLPLRFVITVLVLRLKSGRDSEIFSNGLYEEVAVASLIGSKPSVAKIVGDPVWERYRNKVNPNVGLEEFNEGPIRNLNYHFQRKFLAWSLNRFEVITAPSQQLADLVAKWGVKKKVIVIANGVKVREITPKDKIFDVITVSRLVTWKNVEVLIRVCHELRLKLAIVGSGPDEDRLKKMAAAYEIHFLGELNNEEVFNILLQSRVFALLSNYEGLSHALLEAMNLEVPVIVSSAPGNVAVIRHGVNGHVVDVTKESDLLTSFSKIIEDPEYAANLARNSKRDIRTLFNLDIQLEKFIELLGSNP